MFSFSKIQNYGFVFFFSGLLLLSACAPKPNPVTVQPDLLPVAELPSLDSVDFSKYVLDDMLVLLFPSGLAQQEWKQLFAQANRFQKLKEEARLLSLSRENNVEDLISKQAQIADLLIDLYSNKTAFFFNPTAAFGCFIDSQQWKCSEELQQSLEIPNIGPTVKKVGVYRNNFKIADGLEFEVVSKSSNAAEFSDRYRLKVTLMLEEASEGALKFSGRVESIGELKLFRDGIEKPAHPFGYAEAKFLARPSQTGESGQ